MNTKKISILGLFTAVALTIYVLENAIPTLVPIPGIKLGLSNIVTLYVLYTFGIRDAFVVLTARITLSSIYAGGGIYFLYSLGGGLLSYAVMVMVYLFLQKHYMPVTSIFGSIAHNIGQILVAFFILRMDGIFVYIPFLMISGIITGLFTGVSCNYVYVKLRKYM